MERARVRLVLDVIAFFAGLALVVYDAVSGDGNLTRLALYALMMGLPAANGLDRAMRAVRNGNGRERTVE